MYTLCTYIYVKRRDDSRYRKTHCAFSFVWKRSLGWSRTRRHEIINALAKRQHTPNSAKRSVLCAAVRAAHFMLFAFRLYLRLLLRRLLLLLLLMRRQVNGFTDGQEERKLYRITVIFWPHIRKYVWPEYATDNSTIWPAHGTMKRNGVNRRHLETIIV